MLSSLNSLTVRASTPPQERPFRSVGLSGAARSSPPRRVGASRVCWSVLAMGGSLDIASTGATRSACSKRLIGRQLRDAPALRCARSVRAERAGFRSGCSADEVDDEGGVVAEARAPPVVRVGVGQRPQPVDQDVVDPPAAAIAREGPARLALAVAVQGAEGVDPPAGAEPAPHGSPRPAPPLAALGAQPARAVVREGEHVAVGELATRGVEVAAQDPRPVATGPEV